MASPLQADERSTLSRRLDEQVTVEQHNMVDGVSMKNGVHFYLTTYRLSSGIDFGFVSSERC
jgi:hypothetical protein